MARNQGRPGRKGVDDIPQGDTENLPKMLKSAAGKVFKPGVEHPAHGLCIGLDGQDLTVKFHDEQLLEIAYLPKGKDYIVHFFNDDKLEDFQQLLAHIQPELEEAKAIKAARNKAFRERFKKKG